MLISSLRDLRRWTLAFRAITRFGLQTSRPRVFVKTFTTSSTLYHMALTDINGQPFEALRLFFTIAVYGGIHIMAWNHRFPSTLVMIFWRSSSILLTVVEVATSIYVMSGSRIGRGRKETKQQGDNFARKPCGCLAFGEAFAVACFCFVRSGHLIATFSIWVICFIDFVHLPPAAFVDISWTKFIPHFA